MPTRKRAPKAQPKQDTVQAYTATCTQPTLRKGLAAATRALGRTAAATMPITRNVLIEAKDGSLRLSCTNLELYVKVWLDATMSEEEWAVTMPGRLLEEVVASLPEDTDVTMTRESTHAITVESGRNRSHFIGTEAGEFPTPMTAPDGAPVLIAAAALRTAIEQVAFAASTEPSRPVLEACLLRAEDAGFTMAAADGFRLAVHYGALLEAVEEPVIALIPRRSMEVLGTLLQHAEDPVSITTGESHTCIRFGNIELSTTTIRGIFPDYLKLIPQDTVTVATLKTSECLRAARSAAAMARTDGHGIRLYIEDGVLRITGTTAEMGHAQGEVAADVAGSEQYIAISAKYLTEALPVLGTERVTLAITTAGEPLLVRPHEDDSYVYVVMPLFVTW